MIKPTFAAVMGSLLLSALPSPVSGYRYNPNEKALNNMCLPIYSDLDRITKLGLKSGDTLLSSLANSPFPCEQVLYLQHGCAANGTAAIDFLAEQQCLCNGSFFDVSEGCFLCKQYHGYNETNLDQFQSSQLSISIAECATPATQAYTKLLPSVNPTAPIAPVISPSAAPTQTNVDKYWTPAAPVALGEITGSATGRQTVAVTSSADAVATPTPTPTNAAAGNAAPGAGGLLAVVLGAVLAL